MKTQSKSLMDRQKFPDLAKSFSLFKLAEQVDFITGQQAEHNMLAMGIHLAFCNKRPIRDVLGFVMECYRDNDKAVEAMLGLPLVDKIKSTLCEE